MSKMDYQTIVKKVLEKNSGLDRSDLLVRLDGRIEFTCEHGVGHTLYSPADDYIHGCDRCCEDYTIIYSKDLKD